jgi:hypothetical protein
MGGGAFGGSGGFGSMASHQSLADRGASFH